MHKALIVLGWFVLIGITIFAAVAPDLRTKQTRKKPACLKPPQNGTPFDFNDDTYYLVPLQTASDPFFTEIKNEE